MTGYLDHYGAGEEKRERFFVQRLPRRHALRQRRRTENQGKKYGKRETQN